MAFSDYPSAHHTTLAPGDFRTLITETRRSRNWDVGWRAAERFAKAAADEEGAAHRKENACARAILRSKNKPSGGLKRRWMTEAMERRIEGRR